MSTYVIGDIHGCFNEWIQLRDKIETQDTNAKFIFVGDIIDRGPSTVEMVEWAMKNITNSGKYQMVIGNHELLKIQWWESYYKHLEVYRYDNTKEVLQSICTITDAYDYVETFYNKGKGIRDIHDTIEWFGYLPYYKDITVNNQRYIIVHSNLPYSAIDKEKGIIMDDLSKYSKEFIVWDRGTEGFNKIDNTILIHGHTPTISNDAFDITVKMQNRNYGKIIHTKNRYNVDCGIVFKKRREYANLAALRLEDLKEIYLFD